MVDVRLDSGWELPPISDDAKLATYLTKGAPANRQAVFDSLDGIALPPVVAEGQTEMQDIIGEELVEAQAGRKTVEEALDERRRAHQRGNRRLRPPSSGSRGGKPGPGTRSPLLLATTIIDTEVVSPCLPCPPSPIAPRWRRSPSRVAPSSCRCRMPAAPIRPAPPSRPTRATPGSATERSSPTAMSAAGEVDVGRARSSDWCARAMVARARRGRADRGGGRGRATRCPTSEMLPTRFTLERRASASDDWWDFQLDGYGTWLWAAVAHAERHGAVARAVARGLRAHRRLPGVARGTARATTGGRSTSSRSTSRPSAASWRASGPPRARACSTPSAARRRSRPRMRRSS